MKNFEVPESFEHRIFQMNPQTDDLIRGAELKEGMVVLIEDTSVRADPAKHLEEDHECDIYLCPRILAGALWCRVTRLERRRGDELVSFIGEYHDGTKRSRTYNISYCWFVKKGSIPLVAQ